MNLFSFFKSATMSGMSIVACEKEFRKLVMNLSGLGQTKFSEHETNFSILTWNFFSSVMGKYLVFSIVGYMG